MITPLKRELHKLANSRAPGLESLALSRPLPFKSDTGSSIAVRLKANVLEASKFFSDEWREIFTEPSLAANAFAGVTVSAVAIPLNVALAVAAGLPASTGLVAGAVGGAVSAVFGGSRFQVSGPAAALNVMVFAVASQFGAIGVTAVALIVGAMQVLFALLAAGNLAKYIHEAVLTGFTTGVGLTLLNKQIPKLFDLDIPALQMAKGILHPTWLTPDALPALVCSLFVMVFILSLKSFPRFPAALFAIAMMTELAVILNWQVEKVGAIPPIDLQLALPNLPQETWLQLVKLAIPLAILAAAESLLSARALDRKTGTQHHSNLEVFGQGLGNLLSGLVGGMPVSGVIVRSSVNVQGGATNRLASVIHALVLLGSTLFFAWFLSRIPTAALAGFLCIIGFRLVEISEFIHLFKTNKWQWLGFVSACAGTVIGDIEIGIGAGLAFTALGQLSENKAGKPKSGIHKVAESPEEAALREGNGGVMYRVLDRGERWLHHLKQQASVPNSAFVHPNASVIGRVVLGRNVHVAAEASVRADEGTPFYIGDDTNVQDGVVIHALKKKWVKVRGEPWAVYIGKSVSLAHQALVHGPCFIGDDSFIGFKAVVHDSIIGRGCYVGIGAVVVGVEVPEERYVPHGTIVDTAEKARNLPRISPGHRHFNEDVVEVNKGLVEAYRELSVETTH